jgi:anti-sigma factor RsiW
MADPGDLTCQEFVELVTEYLEGTMPAFERARFAAHLSDCDYCVEYLEQMRQTIRTLGRLGEEHIAPATRNRMLETFRDWKRSGGFASVT